MAYFCIRWPYLIIESKILLTHWSPVNYSYQSVTNCVMYICDCNRGARVSFIVPTDATNNKWLYIMNSDLPSPFSWDIIWHQMNHVSCVALQQNTWDKMSQCCACRSSLFMMTHFFSAIIVLILCCPIPEVIWIWVSKSLDFIQLCLARM